MIRRIYKFPSKIFFPVCPVYDLNLHCILKSKKLSCNCCPIGPVASFCPEKNVSVFFYRILSFSEAFCEAVRLTVKISIFINFLCSLSWSYSDLSSIYIYIFKLCHDSFLLLFFCLKFIARIAAQMCTVMRCTPVCIKIDLIQKSCIERFKE